VREWLDGVLPLGAALAEYKEHIRRWATQDARYEQHLEMVGLAAGRKILIVLDFKEKLSFKKQMREVQGDYWDNSSLSLLGASIYDGHTWRYVDLVSTDTTQDGGWTASGMARLALVLKAMGFDSVDEIIFWSDNGCHFHSNQLFASTLLDFAVALGSVVALSWNFFEHGEGKGPCDQHFAVVSGALRRALVATGSVIGAEDVVGVLNKMNDTSGYVIVVDRSGDGVHARTWTYDRVSAQKQFVLRPDYVEWRSTRDTAEARLCWAWSVRHLTGFGEARAFAVGAFTQRWVKLSDAQHREYLAAALHRRGGVSRVALLTTLLACTPCVVDSKCLGAPGSESYKSAVFVLDYTLQHEFTDGEREVAGVRAHKTPHMLAQAIAQCEHVRRCADDAAMDAAAVAAAAAPLQPAGEASGSVPAAGAACAPARGGSGGGGGGGSSAPRHTAVRASPWSAAPAPPPTAAALAQQLHTANEAAARFSAAAAAQGAKAHALRTAVGAAREEEGARERAAAARPPAAFAQAGARWQAPGAHPDAPPPQRQRALTAEEKAELASQL
jgi:hypothetical protein